MTGDTVDIIIIIFWQMSERKYIKLREFTKKKSCIIYTKLWCVCGGGEGEGDG